VATTSRPGLHDALRFGLPAGSVKTSALYRGVYGRDASCYEYPPAAVAHVSSVADVQHVLSVARDHGVPLTFRAGGTSLCGQALGEGVIVEQRLAWKRFAVRDGGASVWFEPGVILAQLNHVLEPLGRKLGPDPESAPSAMMGGVLANNSGGQQSGVERDPYATLRSAAFVLANGRHYDSACPGDRTRFEAQEAELSQGLRALRERVRHDAALAQLIQRKHRIKNVMGYDLRAFLDAEEPIDIVARLLIGSEGTLAFMTSAVLETVPLHPHWMAGLLFFSGVAEAAAGARLLADGGAATVELMDRSCLRAWGGRPGTPAYVDELPSDATAVLVEFRAASAPELEELVAAAQELTGGFALIAQEPLTADPLVREQWLGL
jgi:D-lactate dehydrogenase